MFYPFACKRGPLVGFFPRLLSLISVGWGGDVPIKMVFDFFYVLGVCGVVCREYPEISETFLWVIFFEIWAIKVIFGRCRPRSCPKPAVLNKNVNKVGVIIGGFWGSIHCKQDYFDYHKNVFFFLKKSLAHLLVKKFVQKMHDPLVGFFRRLLSLNYVDLRGTPL